MKTSILLALVFQAFNIANAASTCKRDSCYNQVNVQSNKNPKYAVRRADCSSVLKTIIADEKTVTVTTTSTFYAFPSLKKRSDDVPQITAAPEPTDEALLDERDKIIANGKRPTYASGCKDIMQYATACLCFGVKAQTYKAGPTKTTTVTAVETLFARGPSCDAPNAQQGGGGCSSNCYCDPRGAPFDTLGVCDTTISCTTQCATDTDCPDGNACIVGGSFGNFCGGSTCVSFIGCTTTFDPNARAPAAKSAKISPVDEAAALAARLGSGTGTKE